MRRQRRTVASLIPAFFTITRFVSPFAASWCTRAPARRRCHAPPPGHTPIGTDPRTDGSAAEVEIDSGTVAVLEAHRERQLTEHAAAAMPRVRKAADRTAAHAPRTQTPAE